MSLAIVHSRALDGLEAASVSVEVHLANGLPAFTLVGLAETEVKESRERVRAALANNFEPEARCTYSAARDCPDGQCVVAALDKQVQRLRTAPTPQERLRALKWVVHLVGDIHQPLHAGPAGSKGGNLTQVRGFGRGTNLHAVWDSGLIKHWPGGLPALREGAAGAEGAAARSNEPEAWAQESCRIASTPDFQPDGRSIGEDYQRRWSPVLAARLQAAAERLARTLEAALP